MGMSSRTQFSQYLYDWAIDEDSKPKFLFIADRGGRIVSAKLHSSATVSAADTNYNTFTIQKGSTALATLANGPASTGVDVTAAGGAFTVGSTDNFDAGDVISLKSAKTGNGLAVADCAVSIVIEYDD